MPVLKIKKADGTWQEVWGMMSNNSNAAAAKLTTVTIPASGWSGSGNIYGQSITCNGITANSTLELRPTPEQVVGLQSAKTSLTLTNNNGNVVAIAIGDKPTVDYTMDVLITEVVRV